MSNLVLIGMRGSGKTTVGKKLAQVLGWRFADTDEFLVKRAQLDIPTLVKLFGWEKFRYLEGLVIKEVALWKKSVIATGGGVVLRQKNISRLKKQGKLIWLKAKIDTLIRRIGLDPNRPSLTGLSLKQDLVLTWQKRKKLYQKYADLIIETDNKKIEEIVKIILKSVL